MTKRRIDAVETVRRVATVIGARAIDLPTRYGMHLLVAAKLGVVQSGLFYIMFSVVTLAAGAGRIGMDRAATRDIARAMAVGDTASARAIALRTLRLVTMLSAAIAAIVAISAAFVAGSMINEPNLARPLLIGAVAIVPLCVSVAAAGILAGLQRVGLSQMIYAWLWPLLFCLAALILPLTVEIACWILLCATTANALAGLVLSILFLPRSTNGGAPPSTAAFLQTSVGLFTTELFQLLLASLPTLAVGALVDARAAGLYALAWRVALILNLLVSAIGAMSAPRFAAFFARQEKVALGIEATRAVQIVMVLGLPVLILLAVVPGSALALLGDGFGDGATILRILLIGQLAAMLGAAQPELLGMIGQTRKLARLNAMSIVMLIVGLGVLGSMAGAVGAAGAVSATLVLNSLFGALMVRRAIGFAPAARLFSLR